jgi:head-tail adaptor
MPSKRSAGQLYEHVAFDERQMVSDGHGNVEGEFVQVFQCRAGFTFLRGSESVIAARLEGRQPIVVRVRASSQSKQIEPDWRMRDVRTGAAYAVQSVAATPDRQWLDILVSSGVAA